MSKKISKKIAAGMLSVLVFGSQIPSGSAYQSDSHSSARPLSGARAKSNKNHIELKGIFDIPGLEQALQRTNYRYDCWRRAFINVSLESRDGHVEVKVGDESFELAYDKLVNNETGEIDEIEIPYALSKIGSGVFKDILKNANAQDKKIKRVILPKNLECASGAFEGASVDCVVLKSDNCKALNENIFENALHVGAVFVPKKLEEEAKEKLKDKNIKVFQDFELRNAFDIKGLKEAIMEALANEKDIKFGKDGMSSSPVLYVGGKEFYPDYCKLKNKETGKIENLELPYGVRYLGSSTLIYNICLSCDKSWGTIKINRVVVPDTVVDIERFAFYHVNINHLVLPKNLRFLNREAFGHVMKQVGVGSIFIGTNCNIKEITAPAKFDSVLKGIFGHKETEFNFI